MQKSDTSKTALVLCFGYFILITYLFLAMPSETQNVGNFDKIVHLCVFVIFVILAYPLCKTVKQLLILSAFLVVYAALIEVIQPFFARSAEFADLLFDILGILLGLVTCYYLDPRSVYLNEMKIKI